MRKFLLILLLLFFAIPFVRASDISFPSQVMINEEFSVLIIADGLSPGEQYKFSVWVYGGPSSREISNILVGKQWKGGYAYDKFYADEHGNWEGSARLKIIEAPDPGYNYYLRCRVKDMDGNDQFTITKTHDEGFNIVLTEETIIELIYPSFVMYETPFDVYIYVSGSGLADGEYDVKIDMLEEGGNRIAEVYDKDDEKWKSSFYYIKDALSIKNNHGNALISMRVTSNYIGKATLIAKIKKGSKIEQSNEYVITITAEEKEKMPKEEEPRSIITGMTTEGETIDNGVIPMSYFIIALVVIIILIILMIFLVYKIKMMKK